MNTRDFMGLVLPPFGNYVLTLCRSTPNGEVLWNTNYETLDECAAAAEKFDARPDLTVYFAVGCHQNNVETVEETGRTKVRRLQATAFGFKTLCFDLDVGAGKPYQTPREGAAALLQATSQIGLPDPMLVLSGYGLHAYYPLTTTLRSEDWVRLSGMLRRALHAHGVVLDWSKIHDPSMVLRPAGTHNKKNPSEWRPVRVLAGAVEHDARALLAHLQPWATPDQPERSEPKRPMSAVAAAILEGGDPIRLDTITGCQQIAAMLADAGASADEPMWRGALGIAKYCDDPEAAIVALAGGHPDFDLADSKAKMERWAGTGPTTCEYFERMNPAGCEGCKFKGQFKSPARLSSGAAQVVVDAPPADVAAENVFSDSEPAESVVIQFPKGYSFANGWLLYRAPGAEEDTPVCPYLMYPEGRYFNIERSATTIRLRVQLPNEGWQSMDLPADTLAKGNQDLAVFFGQRQVFLHDGIVPRVKGYLMSYLADLQKLKPSDYLYDHFGWQADGCFLTGDQILTPSGEERTAHYSRLANTLRDRIERNGDPDKCAQATILFDHPDLKYHGLVYLMGVGAPLMHGSGLSSLLINMYAPDSGSGKTTTGYAILSAFGKPSKLQFTVKDTDNSLYKSIGALHSFGAYIDEITMADPDRLRDMIYHLPQGREKLRMDSGAKDLREPAVWNMPIITSSNRDIYNVLDNNMMSEAEKMRVLQFPFRRVEMFNTGGANIGYKLIQLFDQNHGHIGPAFVQGVMARGGPAAVFDKALRAFEEKYKFSFQGPERFWQAAFVIADAAGEICTELGLIRFDYKRCIRNGLEYVEQLRLEMQKGAMTCVEIINQFLVEHADNVLQIRDYRTKTESRIVAVEPLPQRAVARVELIIDERGQVSGGAYFISRPTIRRWCQLRGADYRRIVEELKLLGIPHDDNGRITLYKGTSLGIAGQIRCLRIDPMSHPAFLDALNHLNRPNVSPDCKPRLAVVS